jgi:hypothetical protein
VSAYHDWNFATLCRSIRAGNVALLQCGYQQTGELFWAICAVNRLEDGRFECLPIARLLDENLGAIILPASVAPGSVELN